MSSTNNHFDIVISTDDNYIQHAMAMLCSLFETNKTHVFTIHVVEKGLSQQGKDYLATLANRYESECVFYDADESGLQNVQFRKKNPLTKAAYYRLILASTLSVNVKKVLYLDCDMIIMGDVSELFLFDISNYALAACEDDFPYTNQHRVQLNMDVRERVFNSGMMMINLEYWRRNNSEKELLEYANTYRKEVYLHDQDVLNYVFKGKWFQLAPKWNRSAFSRHHVAREYYKSFDYVEYMYKPMVLHFCSSEMKPWYKGPSPYKAEYKKYVFLSGYPNVVFQDKGIKGIVTSVRYVLGNFVSTYIWPFMPYILKVLIYDILDLFKIIKILFLNGGKGLKEFLLLRRYRREL